MSLNGSGESIMRGRPGEQRHGRIETVIPLQQVLCLLVLPSSLVRKGMGCRLLVSTAFGRA
jgi:hypothetical protein